jgi:hypothetical protein
VCRSNVKTKSAINPAKNSARIEYPAAGTTHFPRIKSSCNRNDAGGVGKNVNP